ncbi:hypothetical protein [Conexibacter sp. W3-3-2]|uniref:hypothetical protein n=1 Tax=Conexibacter sp. W3-3-2 TaxID=2675227 RepID=UPI001E420535|nr:hypothetical protein [Conexibacter sp. W3-3-2]
MATWDRIKDLPLTIEEYALERLQRDVSTGFLRVTTVIRLQGGGHDGVGEDVSYEAEDQDALQAAGPVLPLAGTWTLESFCDHLATLDLWPEPPRHEASRLYRVWAYESAALDLALRQAGRALHEVVGREPRPLTFVMSLRLGQPSTIAPLRARLDPYPTLRFKLDPTADWDDALIAELVATGAVDSVDLKGLYEGSVVDNAADPDLYRRVAEAFPDAWIEDPKLTPETDPVLAPYRDRITWDAPIHSVADIDALPFPPRMVNVKPSRLGACGRCCTATTPATNAGSACTAAVSSSSVRAAARSSTWRRCSTPTRPTTWRPAPTTRTRPRRASPRARSPRRRPPWASAGTAEDRQARGARSGGAPVRRAVPYSSAPQLTDSSIKGSESRE